MRCSICAGDWGRRFAQNTVVDLSDGSTVNSLFDLHGVRSFQYEYERAKKIKWLGAEVVVLPLPRIYASKKFVGRPKDLADLPLLKQTMKLQARPQTPVNIFARSFPVLQTATN